MNRSPNGNGAQTQMPSVRLSLGRYVTTLPRKDGTFRVLFQVPPRLRPSGWSPTIVLPLNGQGTGNLADAYEVACIQRDAAIIYNELLAARAETGGPLRLTRTFEALIETWQASQAYKDNRPRTNIGYEQLVREVRAWAELNGQPDPTEVTAPVAEGFLAAYDDRPTTRYHLRKVFRMVMQQAVRLRWRPDNPVDEVKVAMPKSRVVIWEEEDVDLYAWAALAAGNPSLAALILTVWETGQRLTDVALFRHGAEYQGGVFSFDQSKTLEPVTVEISDRLRTILEIVARKDSIYLFHDAGTGRPYRNVDRLSHVFEDVRKIAMQAGGRHLVLRALRHSCVVQLARAGCEIPEIISVTGHSPGSAYSILKTYLPRDSRVARRAQEKRGLIKALA